MPDASRTSAAWQAGSVIKERYRLESLLRRGGMGMVWRAEHLELRAPVAIKLLEPEVARDPVMVQRFLREAQAAAALRSPNVVQILDYGVEGGQAFIAMEMLEGEPLSERIARLRRVPAEELFRFLSDVLRAMQKAHDAGIIHRDLKPDNIFICKDEPEFAKVLDFGVAKVKKGVLSDATGFGTQTGMMLGTPYYMSPEQAQAKELDQRSDLWSIAVIAFEALVGRRPFVAEAFGDLVIAICTAPTPIPSRFGPVPPGFDEWFVHGTQRDMTRRFASARDMAEELERVLRPGATTGGHRYVTGRAPQVTPVVTPSPTPAPRGVRSSTTATPRSLSVPAESPSSRDLQMTTGQRSAVTRTASLPAPEKSSNAGLFALLGVGALILLGVLVFALGGGARALRQAELGVEQKATAGATLPERALLARAPGAVLAAAQQPSASASAATRAPATR